MRRIIGSLFSLALVFSTWLPRAEAQLFQNNNASCEDQRVEGVNNGGGASYSIACGRYNDDTSFGNPDFSDCATEVDPLPFVNLGQPVTNSILMNTGAHGNNCANTGGVNQFSSAVDLAINQLNPGDNADIRMGSIVKGNLNGGPFDDLAFVVDGFQGGGQGRQSVDFLFSQASGGFGPGGPTNESGSASLDPFTTNQFFPFPIDPGQTYGPGGSFGFANTASDRSVALLDCDGDSLDEGIVAVAHGDTAGSADAVPGIMMLPNSGSGLGSTSTVIDLPGNETRFLGMSLTVGNFVGNSNLDLAVAVDNAFDSNAVFFCTGLGDCGFTCPGKISDPTSIDLTQFCPLGPGTCELRPTSIATGDFNGDGLPDIVVAEHGGTGPIHDIRYFFNNGGAPNTWSSQSVDLVAATECDTVSKGPVTVSVGRFSTAAIQNNFDEVAVTVRHFGALPCGEFNDETNSTVDVVTSNGGGVLNPVLELQFPINSIVATGIDSKNFDHCGGDDIVALSEVPQPNESEPRFANLFLNTNEPPVANAGPDLVSAINTATPITATCTDPTNDDQTFTWSILSQPTGAAASVTPTTGNLTGTNTNASASFTAGTNGVYTLQLSCVDFCQAEGDDTVQITLQGNVPPPPPPPVLPGQTQGGCLASLHGPVSGGPKIAWGIFLFFPLFLLARRLRKKSVVTFGLFLLVLGASGSSKALTTSFSVNTFEPTIDDSEYFTIYSSPTMLKRDFHVGFYLDYAHHPYEFGDPNFNRTGGVVDHLITGNIVGSYAVLDWMTVGALIPVYFWEGIRAPALGLNSNNFDLGDIQIILKFRVLDREKHHVGIAIVPFLSVPSSTGASDFLGNGSVAGGAKVVLDGRIKDRVSLALNVGYLARDAVVDVSGNKLDDQFLAGLGISIDILKHKLMLIGEAQIATVTSSFFSNRRTTPAEARVGFRYTFAHDHDINVGGGFGLSNGIGSPDFRAFIGYTYTKRPVAEVTVPQPPISEVNVGDELTLKDKIYFEFDKAAIRDISKPTLDKIAGFLKAHPEVTKIKIDGYTCDLGSVPYNLRLSQKRAQSVVEYLEGQGIEASRIGTVTGHGKSDPLVPNVDEASREQNRRVQIFVEAVQK